jgi:uncharacterized membrane protein YedE/YeeE
MTAYWPWWLGASALATVAVLHPLLTGRLFGVSGLFGRALNPGALKEERDLKEIGDLERAMLDATLIQFGAAATDVEPVSAPSDTSVPAPRLSFSASWLFIVSVAAGGALSALSSGRFGTLSMGTIYHSLFGSGTTALLTLFGGGFLVGFGTQMTGGCTSGHGLSGCGRFRIGSLLATASFFGTGIVASLAFVRWLQ